MCIKLAFDSKVLYPLVSWLFTYRSPYLTLSGERNFARKIKRWLIKVDKMPLDILCTCLHFLPDLLKTFLTFERHHMLLFFIKLTSAWVSNNLKHTGFIFTCIGLTGVGWGREVGWYLSIRFSSFGLLCILTSVILGLLFLGSQGFQTKGQSKKWDWSWLTKVPLWQGSTRRGDSNGKEKMNFIYKIYAMIYQICIGSLL